MNIPFVRPSSTSKLEAITWLRDISKEERDLIDRNTSVVTVAADSILCSEGGRGFEAFIVLAGEAAVIAQGRLLARLEPGAVCGEMALIRNEVRSAQVVARSTMQLLVMSKNEFDVLLHNAPTVNHHILETLAHRLDLVNRRG